MRGEKPLVRTICVEAERLQAGQELPTTCQTCRTCTIPSPTGHHAQRNTYAASIIHPPVRTNRPAGSGGGGARVRPRRALPRTGRSTTARSVADGIPVGRRARSGMTPSASILRVVYGPMLHLSTMTSPPLGSNSDRRHGRAFAASDPR